jgi:myosin protein heavy chain
MDIEDKESSMEQTRKKYQAEFATLTKELDLAREEKLFKQAEIARLREELDDLRAKWDDEVLNSSTWSKEKARLEATLADVASSRDEAVGAHNEAQGKVVSLLSQVRTLRASVDDITAERDALQREKRSVEARLKEAKAGLEELARQGESPSLRSAAGMDRELLELRSSLAQQEDIAAAAVEKMRRAEALASEIQKDAAYERENGAQLQKEKAALEKALNEVQVRVVDLETKGYSSASQDIKFLHKRIQEVCTPLRSLRARPPAMLTETRHSSSRNWKPRRRRAPSRSGRCATSTGSSRTCSRRSTARTSRMGRCRRTCRGCGTSATSCSRPSTSCSRPSRRTSCRRGGLSGSCARSARSRCG